MDYTQAETNPPITPTKSETEIDTGVLLEDFFQSRLSTVSQYMLKQWVSGTCNLS